MPRALAGTLMWPSSVAAPAGILTSVSILKRARISFGQFTAVPRAGPLERLEGTCFIEMNDRVELVRQASLEIMAQSLRLGPVDDADGALEPLLAQQIDGSAALFKINPKARKARGMKELFVTSRQSGTNALAFCGFAPIRRRGDGARISSEANRESFPAETLAHELADIELATPAHGGRAGVPEVRIMGPDNDFRLAAIQMGEQLG